MGKPLIGYNTEPVTVIGKDLQSLIGMSTGSIVGFKFNDITKLWKQIPIQIDERHWKFWSEIKHEDCRLKGYDIGSLVYADPNTYSGADEDPMFDENDEMVFMVKDAGDWASSDIPGPSGTEPGKRVEIRIQNPFRLQYVKFIYLFISNILKPNADKSYVDYNFNVLSWNKSHDQSYKETFDYSGTFGNLEDSSITTKYYHQHFKGTWYTDSLSIKVGNSTRENFIETDNIQFNPDTCLGSIETFTHSPTAFIANINGPVRGIRSFVGGGDGTLTQQDVLMYEQRQDVTTYLRIHPLHGFMRFMSYRPQVLLTYYNSHNFDGVSINGKDNNFNRNLQDWEMVTGKTGSYIRSYHWDTDISHPQNLFRNWFYDSLTPLKHATNHPHLNKCSANLTGETSAWGTSGVISHSDLPNTDPLLTSTNDHPDCNRGWPREEEIVKKLTMKLVQYYYKPDVNPKIAVYSDKISRNPLFTRIRVGGK